MVNLKSYVSANTMPAKLLQSQEVVGLVRLGFIPPVHVQLNPTNRCNLNCEFCSCSERDKRMEIDTGRLLNGMEEFKKRGCQAVTITGGGEPLLYENLQLLIYSLTQVLKIKVGLVTNGTQFSRVTDYRGITWLRISSSDDREPDWEGISRAVSSGNRVAWGFSHVLTRKPNWEVLGKVVGFANDHHFTHVRVVGDILDAEESAAQVDQARLHLLDADIVEEKVVYQGRANYTRGRERCLISLLKPVVGADGGIYPCCGVQYAQESSGRDYVENMRMGWLEDIPRIWKDQAFFNGDQCTKCYYDDYNVALDSLTQHLDHAEFI